MESVDVTIIGAGIIGLSIASEVGRAGRSVLLLEKNHSWGQETSSRNSEVIHTGIYYQPWSLKAISCRMDAKTLNLGIYYFRCSLFDQKDIGRTLYTGMNLCSVKVLPKGELVSNVFNFHLLGT